MFVCTFHLNERALTMSRNWGIGDAHQGDDSIWPCGSDENDERTGEPLTLKDVLILLGIVAVVFSPLLVPVAILVSYWLGWFVP